MSTDQNRPSRRTVTSTRPAVCVSTSDVLPRESSVAILEYLRGKRLADFAETR